MPIPVNPALVAGAIALAPQTGAYNSAICPGSKFIAFQVKFDTALTFAYDFKAVTFSGKPAISQVAIFIIDTVHCTSPVTITFDDSGYEQNILPGTNGVLLAVTGLRLPKIYIQSQGIATSPDYINITAFDTFFPGNLMQQQVIINDNVSSLISINPSAINGSNTASFMGAPGGLAVLKLTPQLIKSAPGSIYGTEDWNLDGTTNYINFYDAASTGVVTPGTTTPLFSIQIGGNNSWEAMYPADVRRKFSTGIVVNASAGTPGSNTAPTNGVQSNIDWF